MTHAIRADHRRTDIPRTPPTIPPVTPTGLGDRLTAALSLGGQPEPEDPNVARNAPAGGGR